MTHTDQRKKNHGKPLTKNRYTATGTWKKWTVSVSADKFQFLEHEVIDNG